jgi:predicted DNA-binding protein (MmcQ/YjbR family)
MIYVHTNWRMIMKCYSEEQAIGIRLALEKEVLGRPEVSTKKMFDCPGYQAKGELFALLATNGIVVTQLEKSDSEVLSNQHETTFFEADKKTVRSWIKILVEDKRDLDRILPFVRKSYEEALRKE